MRAFAITFCAASIVSMAAVIFITGRFDLAGVAVIGAAMSYFAWAIWDDLD